MMAQTFIGRKRVRKFFGKIKEVAEMPNLIEVQKASYDQFLLVVEPQGGRPNEGLQAVFKSVFPISDFSNTSMLEFVKYEFEGPKYDVDECRQRGMTYAAPLKVTLRLIVFDIDEETGAKSVKDIKEQDVYMGDIPLMTNNGTFIVNGTERVIVSQMHRSPGVFFDHDKGKTHSSGKLLFAARIIPYRGSWLDIEFDAKDIVHARVDRRRKIPGHVAALCARHVGEEILNTFYKQVPYKRTKDGWRVPFDANRLRGYKAINDLVDADTGKVVLEAGKKLTVRQARQLAEKGLKALRLTDQELIGHYIAEDLVNPKTGEIYAEAGEEITEKTLKTLNDAGYKELPLLNIDHVNVGAYIRNTLAVDKNMTREDALFDIYRVMRPGEPPTIDTAQAMFRAVLRQRALRPLRGRPREDEHAARSHRRRHHAHFAQGGHHRGDPHAGRSARRQGRDRRHRPPRQPPRALGRRADGEPVPHRPLRMERAIKERMSSVDIDTLMPHDLINAKPAAAACGVLRLLAALAVHGPDQPAVGGHAQAPPLGARAGRAHARARRLRGARRAPDALRPHLPDRDAGRAEHRPHRSLATFARVNKYGFVETPYRKVKDGRVTDEVIYLSAMEEGKYIAQANGRDRREGQASPRISSRAACRRRPAW
jgi:DNA-directed RNA polymerase subunit beta